MEQRDLYDKDRKPTGKTIYKGEEVPEGSYIVVVLIYIQNSEGKFLIQKRSARKNGLYATTGGHPKHGESSIEGIITEVKEEIGLDLNPDDLTLYYGGRSETTRVFWDNYYIKMDIDDISKLKLQEEEVESLHWFSADEIHNLMKDGKFFKNHYEEFEVLVDWFKRKSNKAD